MESPTDTLTIRTKILLLDQVRKKCCVFGETSDQLSEL